MSMVTSQVLSQRPLDDKAELLSRHHRLDHQYLNSGPKVSQQLVKSVLNNQRLLWYHISHS